MSEPESGPAAVIEIVSYRRSYNTFCVTVDRERNGEGGITSGQIEGLIRSGHSGIIAKRGGHVVGFAFYKVQSRSSGNRTRKTLWITRISTLPSSLNDDALVSSEILKHLKHKALMQKISVSSLVKQGSCFEMGAEAASYILSEKSNKGSVEAVRIESGRGARAEVTKNRISQYFQGKK